MDQKSPNKLIFSTKTTGKESKGKISFFKGELVNASYSYSGSECYLYLIYKDGRKYEILASDLGLQIFTTSPVNI